MSEDKLVLLGPEDQLYLQIMEDLNEPQGDGIKVGLKSRLHPDQIEQLKPLYQEGKKDLFLSCGRKWGKTELIAYVLWRHALLNPGSACYYVGPEAAHAKKIIWDGGRIQKFMGKNTSKYIQGKPNNLTMMIKLKNGSFIQIVGSDNYMVANGLTPSIAVYDEFKGFNYRWHIEFAPNRAAKAAPLIIIGTKPRIGNKNMDQYNDILDYMRNDPDAYVADRTTFDNPINHLPEQKKIIEKEIASLKARGEDDVVQLEYYSKVVPGGKRAIFPMLDQKVHTKPFHVMYNEIRNDLKKMEWYCIADPGTTTCFAVLFAAINPYTKKVYILKEIYEKDQSMTSVRMMYPRMVEIMKKLNPHGSIEDDWYKVFDEAAAWFSNEVMQQYGSYFAPTMKAHNKKEHGISLIKDQLIHNLVEISEDCPNLFKEAQQYAKDDQGKIPKKNDHLIDDWRYLNAAANYNMLEAMEAIKNKVDPIKDRRFRKFRDEDDMEGDWLDNIFRDY